VISPADAAPDRFRLPPRLLALAAIALALVVVAAGALMLPALGAAAPATPSASVAAGSTGSTGAASPTPYGSHDPTPAPPVGLSGYVWPLAGAQISLPFGPTKWGEFVVDGKPFHDGVDLASECGDPVMAAHDGVVLAAGRHYDEQLGWVEALDGYFRLLDRKHWWDSLPITVVIDDGNGFRSIYSHESSLTVAAGDRVKAGQVIGYEGRTGNASGCHVHFGLFRTTETATFALDPDVVARDQMPAHEIARVNPLWVLPLRCEFDEMRTLRPAEAEACPQSTH
jgi:murein DD-endopeptidase MepM/ murein hydrolase activator NlpD